MHERILSAATVPLVGALALIPLIYVDVNTSMLPQWFQAIVGLGAFFLTGALVLLYWQQKTIANEQLRHNHEPELRVEGYGAAENDFEFCLSNVGEGPADELTLEITASSIDEARESDTEEKIEFETVEKVPMKRLTELENRWVRPPRNYIDRRTRHVTFWTPLGIGWEQADQSWRLEHVPGKIDADVLRVQVDLTYRTRFDETDRYIVVDDVIPMKENLTLEALLSHGVRYESYQKYERDLDRIHRPWIRS